MKAEARNLVNIAIVESEGMTLRFAFASLALIATMALVMVLFLSHPAYGYTPHGPFGSDTDKCGSCHRIHNNQADKLLPVSSTTELCVSCHSKGQGADTAVMEGAYVDGLGSAASHTWGSPGALLLGGGFQYIGNSQAVTGNHKLGVLGTPYGSANGAIYSLGCADCHTPHYNDNYRLLRRRPGGNGPDMKVSFNGPWTDASQTVPGGDYKAFTITDFSAGNPHGETEYTRNYKDGIAAWCAVCHDKYMTRGWPATDVYNAGDSYGPATRYRHAVGIVITGGVDDVNGQSYNLSSDLPLEDVTGNGRTADDRLTCLSCHAAHGSAAQMHGDAILGPDRGSLPTGADGLLLRTDGRRLCGECHNIAGS
jgi:predicted CXXCH cytochrome family protein